MKQYRILKPGWFTGINQSTAGHIVSEDFFAGHELGLLGLLDEEAIELVADPDSSPSEDAE